MSACVPSQHCIKLGVVAQTEILTDRWSRKFRSSRPAWAAEQVQRQPGLGEYPVSDKTDDLRNPPDKQQEFPLVSQICKPVGTILI